MVDAQVRSLTPVGEVAHRRGRGLLHLIVYDGVMTRTNIEIDEALVNEAMRRYGLHSKRAAVDLALRRLVGEAMTREEALAMEGAGWEGDLAEVRRGRQVTG